MKRNPPNYLEHMIDSYEKCKGDLFIELDATKFGKFMYSMFGLFLSGKRFWCQDSTLLGEALPTREELMNLHLPYPEITIEYETPEYMRPKNEYVWHPKKRILYIQEKEDRFVFFAAWKSEVQEFQRLTHYAKESETPLPIHPDFLWSVVPIGLQIFKEHLGEVEIEKENFWVKAQAIALLENFDAKFMDQEAKEVLSRDMAEDAVFGFSFVNFLQCDNVPRETIRPSEKLNKKRKAKGQLPFSEYHVLDLNVLKEPGVTGCFTIEGRRSPRQHWRRGHIRTYETGKKIWVKPTIVGEGEWIEKTYKV